MATQSLAGRLIPVSLVGCAAILCSAAPGGSAPAPASEAFSHVGERVTLCGEVTSTDPSRRGIPKSVHLGQFKVRFEVPFLDGMAEWNEIKPGNRVCVTGLVEAESDLTFLVVSQPRQMWSDNAPAPHQGLSLVGADPSDEEIRAVLVQQSQETYGKTCPCPESVDSRGRRCGKRSAYEKRGGSVPLCYPSDVSDDMIARFRSERGLSKPAPK